MTGLYILQGRAASVHTQRERGQWELYWFMFSTTVSFEDKKVLLHPHAFHLCVFYKAKQHAAWRDVTGNSIGYLSTNVSFEDKILHGFILFF